MQQQPQMPAKPANNKAIHWYALKVFNNRLLQMQETIQRDAEEYYGNEGISENKTGVYTADPEQAVQTYIAMTEVDRALPQKPGKNTLVSYSGEQMADILASKRDIIRIANKQHQVVTYKKPLVASLMFIRCTETFLKTLKQNHLSEFSYYTRFSGTTSERKITAKEQILTTQQHKVPAIIPDNQMQAFIWLTSEDHRISFLGEPKDIKLGDRVKVIEGPFKGLIGNIKRIKKDRKFVLTIGTIAAFTIDGITHKMVEIIDDDPNPL